MALPILNAADQGLIKTYQSGKGVFNFTDAQRLKALAALGYLKIKTPIKTRGDGSDRVNYFKGKK
jgi:hypothetical protein